jgi:choline kinase
MAHREEERMKGLIAAAGLSTRLQDLCERRNKVLLDLGGESILSTILTHFEQADIRETTVMAGFDAFAVRMACGTRAHCLLNPFYEQYGILGSLWLARPYFDGQAFVFTTGDHYFAGERFQTFLADQPDADILVDVHIKQCDDEDMKVFLNRGGKLRTMTKTFLEGPVLGEFTGAVRFSAEGSTQLFTTLEKHVWQHGIQGYVADILCATHRKWELAFHLSTDSRRVEVDFPCDLNYARKLYAQQSVVSSQ